MACGFCEGWGANVLATVFVDYVVKPTVRHVGYVFGFEKMVKELREKRLEQLKAKQASVEESIKEAENQIQKIDAVVQLWRTDASTLQQDVESFLEANIQESKRCFNWCPDLCWRYRIGKQAAEKSLAISEIMDKSKFEVIGHPADLPGISLVPSKGFVSSKSADFAAGQIMEALKDDGVKIIGVWGMGGVGKTTLVKQVGRKAKEELKLFGEVVVVTVSQNPNIGKIQDDIADLLNLTLDKKSEAGKAEQLCTALVQKKESILIILDDLWRELNLMEIGIPIDGHRHNGCKILLTTRSQQVCSDMGSGKVVPVDVLDKEEAWQLFKICAALDDDTPSDILNEAAKVVEECKGLPIALSALGKALKGKGAGLTRWREASRSLKSSKWPAFQSLSDDEKNAYKCLRVSYDFLAHEETKKCFLLCCLYPEDHLIPIEELVRHAWGLELFQGMESIQEARDALCTAVNDLKACSLLLDDGEKWVKMHDVVRDVALWISSQKENHFVIKAELGAKEWPRNENFEHCTAISFMHCNIKGIPQGLKFPKLELLSFSGKRDEDEIVAFSGGSFEEMASLTVLNMVHINGSLILQDALQFLTNLRSLYLEYCRLNRYSSFSSLGNLNKLEILSFKSSDIEVLPNEVGELKSLRLLDLSWCVWLKRIPPNVIQRLSQLEELYLGHCRLFNFNEWQIQGTDAQLRNASLLELNELPHLTILVLEVSDFECFPEDFVFPKLQNYSLAIGNTGELYPSRRCLKLSKTTSLHVFQNLFEVEWLELYHIVNCQNLVSSLGLNSLSILEAWYCEDMEYLVDPRNQHVPVTLSNLTVLNIQYMNCFKGLCNGPPPNGFLKKLETLEISSCRSLQKSLFPASVTKNLLQLKSLKIGWCQMLEQVFEEIGDANRQVLQKLESLEIRSCSSLRSLFPASVAKYLVKLKSLEIAGCDMLEQISKEIGSSNDEAEVLQKLETVDISECGSLKILFSASVTKNLLQLQTLKIVACGMLEQIFEKMAGVYDHQVLQSLETLDISRCGSLKSLFPASVTKNLLQLKKIKIAGCGGLEQILEKTGGAYDHQVLQKLETLEISSCGSLKSLFPVSITKNLLQLKKIKIGACDVLEKIFEVEDANGQVLPKLETLDISVCDNLKYLLARMEVANGEGSLATHIQPMYVLPNLTTLEINDCPKLRPFNTGSFQMEKITIWGDCWSNESCNIPMVPQLSQNSSNMEYAVLGINHVEEMFHLQEYGDILSNLKRFEVRRLPELRVIWTSPAKQIATLQNLEEIEVVGCNRLRYIFSPLLARSLPKLRSLRIEWCEDLEQIVDTSSQDHDQQQSLSFPSLNSITIEDCKNLKYLFSTSIVHHLQRLISIRIVRASKLEQVFGCEDKAYAKDHDEEAIVQLPSLQSIQLFELPNLISFSSVDYHFVFPSFNGLQVMDCPRMTSTFSVDYSYKCGHARPQIEDTSAFQEIMWRDGGDIDWDRYATDAEYW